LPLRKLTEATPNMELSRFAIAICVDELRSSLDHLTRAADAAWTLKDELGLSYDEFERYCQREFALPPELLIGLLKLHQCSSSRPQPVNDKEK
jgi:hypothetical protein